MPHFLFQLSLFWPKFGPLIIGIIGKPLFILAEISMTTAVTISPVILVQTKLQTDKHRQTKITPHQLSPKRGKQVYRRRYEKPLFAATHMLTPVAYSRGGGAMMRPPRSDREFLDIFFTVFVSFNSRLNRVPRLLVIVRVVCLVKTASKCTQTCHFWIQKMIFSGEVARLFHHTPPLRRLQRLAPTTH